MNQKYSILFLTRNHIQEKTLENAYWDRVRENKDKI